MIVQIYIENERLDLFEDESISITSSVLDIQDISKNTTDYSNAFTVPASERNNKVFKHYYNANIDNTFDARVSVDGRIEIGGMPFKVGKILLQKVSVRGGVPSNYTINFWGNLVSLKDVLGDDKLADLDLSAYDHSYDSTTVRNYLLGASGYPAIIYNLLVKKQYYYNSASSDVTMTDTLANIHYKPDTSNGVTWDDLRASISLTSIVDAIETDYGIVFSDDFWGLDTFKKLYMWLNNSTDKKAGGNSQIADFKTGDTDNINFGTDIGTFYTNGNAEYWRLFFRVVPDEGYEDVEYTINFYENNDAINGSLTGSGQQTLSSLLRAVDTTYLAYWEIKSNQEFSYSFSCGQAKYSGPATVASYVSYGDGTLDSQFVISENIPDLKIIDFLKGIFQAFKLVVIPQNDGTVYVDTVNNYYANGQVLDLTNYIDADEVEVSRGSILNTINYNFQEPQTILNKVFEENNDIAYGDEEAQIRDSNGKLLDGETLEIKLPFEQIIYERLNDDAGTYDINLLYGAVIDKELNPVNPKPHIFYNQKRRVNGAGIGFINDNGTKTQIRGEINMPSHTIDDDDPTDSFIFSEEYNNFSGGLLSNNLYTNYHKEYIDSLFNVKRRNFRFTTKILPVKILLDLTLNDIIKIGYNYYRLDKFTTDITTGKTELNLVNLV